MHEHLLIKSSDLLSLVITAISTREVKTMLIRASLLRAVVLPRLLVAATTTSTEDVDVAVAVAVVVDGDDDGDDEDADEDVVDHDHHDDVAALTVRRTS